MIMLTIVSFSLFMTFMVWAPAAAILYIYRRLRFAPSERAHFYWRVLKWPALAGILAIWATGLVDQYQLISPDLFFYGLFLAYWITFRNAGRDDNHHTEPRRVRARLKQVGGRLVIVSETTTA